MGKDFLERLSSEVLIMFAPMQTLLMDWGKDLESHLSEWVLQNPEKYQEALTESYAAGCDMGHTATQARSASWLRRWRERAGAGICHSQSDPNQGRSSI